MQICQLLKQYFVRQKRQRLSYKARLKKVREFFAELPDEYITQPAAQKLAVKYARTRRFLQKRQPNFNRQIWQFLRFMANCDRDSTRLNQQFVRRELKAHKKLFDNIDGKSLDSQQRRAIVTDEYSNLILAGAGSGKTLTIAGKVQYLTQARGVDPQKILLLSFTRKAVTELQERLTDRLGIKIPVWTFHQLGLHILRQHGAPGIAGEDFLSKTARDYFTRSLPQDEPRLLQALNFAGIQPQDAEELARLKNQVSSYPSADWPLAKLAQLSCAFINLLKSSGREPAHLIAPQNTQEPQTALFLQILQPLFDLYQSELAARNQIDFNDMINQAARLVQEQGSPEAYQYIIVDEYQDISLSRFQLIKALREKTGARLICVGDDWQSIYRFAGSEVSLFTDFARHAGYSALLKIENTYRNSQNLIDTAARFIQANPAQLKKKLHSRRRLRQPLRIIKYARGQALSALEQAVLNIMAEHGEEKSILVLGRHYFDLQSFLPADKTGYQLFQFNSAEGKIIYTRRPKLKINYLTAHKAKGLEADNVIVLNLSDRALGFPNQMTDDPLLSLVLAKAEDFPLAEERRLFYVAITRTRNATYLLTPRQKPSRFVTELSGDRNVRVSELAAGDKPLLCPRCQTGHLIIQTKHRRTFLACASQPLCWYRLEI
jgi:superfamily I DNA/RNA helicase